MFINDDGLQIIDEDERRARIEFYADHSIGWTARPKHGLNGFVRKGKFKKVRRLYEVSLLFTVTTAYIIYVDYPIAFHFNERKWLTSSRLGFKHELWSHDLLQS